MTKYVRNNKTISGRLHEEFIMMDINQGKYFSLNNVASRIWVLLDKPMAEAELFEVLQGEYDVNPVKCRVEVQEFLKEMLSFGLILEIE